MALKFGKKPPVFNRNTMRTVVILAHHLDPLGPPPPTSNRYIDAVTAQVGSNWGMMGNDQYGCCVEADDGHSLMLRTATTGKIVVPTTQDILNLYSAETGFNPSDPSTDMGTDEFSDCRYMRQTGLLGHKADVTGSINPDNFDHIRWSTQLFGGVKTGLIVSNSMMQQFQAGKPWTWTGDTSQLGGHDVPIVHYDQTFFYGVTWGKLQPMTQEFLDHQIDEAHALLFFDWINAQGISPGGFNLYQLSKDLIHVVSGT